jgi:hypothetical protein
VNGGTVATGNFTAKRRNMDGTVTKAGSEPYSRPVDAPAPTVDGTVGGWRRKPTGSV